MEVIKTGKHLGAEIRGVDLSKPLSDAQFEAVSQAFFEHQVVVFPDQRLEPQQQIDFTKRFGTLEHHVRKESRLEGYPEIFVLSNILDEAGKPIGALDAGRFWHSDLSYKQHPSMLSALYSVEIPEKDGVVYGDTHYASVVAAYDHLPDAMKKRLEGLSAVHSYAYYRRKNRLAQMEEAARGGRVIEEPELSEEQLRSVPDMSFPIVRTHPVTGRKALFVNEAHTSHIVGMDQEEGDRLLAELYAHIIKPEFRHTHRWRRGDLLMWDNTAAQHKATFDYALPLRRLMYRTTVRGSVPY
ncbi:MAG: TauD/TfdA family dioxygenase [Pigmentiphaga sp.]|uniref:TauD/TfdA dioxygenase family protein n=1 Tax=Pigmentiphaga sp. TaxID=1977564 RepID=UPI0029A0C701|nr:TauD/TfdA family dioxygenase [Pigmentiphaga sp.]MDX3905883.1 TauD/TfdA family dioxygenase [Pigmentiphaga sp.]